MCAAFKNDRVFKQDDLRRRRDEQHVEIRRQKRDEKVSQRRNVVETSDSDSNDENGGAVWDPQVRVARAMA